VPSSTSETGGQTPASGTVSKKTSSHVAPLKTSPRLLRVKRQASPETLASSTKKPNTENLPIDLDQLAAGKSEVRIVSDRANKVPVSSNATKAKQSQMSEDKQNREFSSEESADSSNCWSIERFENAIKTSEGPADKYEASYSEQVPSTRPGEQAAPAAALAADSAALATADKSTVEQAGNEVASTVSRKKKRRNLGMSAAEHTVTIQLYSESAISVAQEKAEVTARQDELSATGTAVQTTALQEPVKSSSVETVSKHNPCGTNTTSDFSKAVQDSSVAFPPVGSASTKNVQLPVSNFNVLSPDFSSSSTSKKKRKRLNISDDCETIFSCIETTPPAAEKPAQVSDHVSVGIKKQPEMEKMAAENGSPVKDRTLPPVKKKRAKLSMCSDSHVTSVVSSR
jgi:hypothetical protein